MKTIIIGGGVSGLASAIRLAAKGVEVEVFEKRERAGGRMNLVEGNGFRFDLGPTIVMMPDIYKDVFKAAGRNPDDYIPMTQLDPLYNLQFSPGEKHDVSTDLVHFTKYLEGISEQDAEGFLKYLGDIYGRYLIAKDNFIFKSFHGLSDILSPKSIRDILRLKTFDSAWHSISKYVKDDRLRKMLSFQTLYIGIAPKAGPSLYTIIPMIEMLYGVWFMKGGMYALVEGMLKLLGELKVPVHCSTAVDEIIVTGGAAKGVRIGDRIIEADTVLCTADFPWAMKNLIRDKKARGRYTDKKIEKMEYSCSCMMLYLGIKKKLPDLQVHNITFAQDFERNITDIFSGKLPEDPSLYFYCPSKMDASLAPKGSEALYVLIPVPNLKGNRALYEAASLARYREIILKRIEGVEGLGDIRKHIVFEKMVTPLDFEKDVNAYHGATFGLAPTLLQSSYFRPHNKSSTCKGLYFAGSSVHPGAGVPIVLTSAKIAADDILSNR